MLTITSCYVYDKTLVDADTSTLLGGAVTVAAPSPGTLAWLATDEGSKAALYVDVTSTDSGSYWMIGPRSIVVPYVGQLLGAASASL